MPHSIKAYLALGASLFVAVAVLLGLLGVLSLRYVNVVSAEIAGRWLPGEILIGDLNNFTSDFPASERAALLASGAGEITQHIGEMNDLDREIDRSDKAYAALKHGPEEIRLYRTFRSKWLGYRAIVGHELSLLRQGGAAAALSLYRTRSLPAYNAASDTLGVLTKLTFTGSQEASTRAQQAFRTTETLIIGAIFCVCVLMLAAVVFTHRRLLKPLLGLSSAIRRLAAHDMAVDIVGTERRDEIGEVARSVVVFRENAVDLAISRDSLAQQARILEKKLSEEQRLATLQRNFISMVSHEFRTPLTTIDMHAQRLMKVRNRVEACEFEQRIGKIRAAVLHMTNLIGGIIETARIDDTANELRFRAAELHVHKVLRKACEFHCDLSSRVIKEKFRAETGRIEGDAGLLFQLFSNLLGNALKYSSPDKDVEVETANESHWITIAVRDLGIGIRQDDIPHIFERFFRGRNASHIAGTGIGLYFVATVVALHGGHISVESEEGMGSVFKVRLPLQPEAIASCLAEEDRVI